MRNRLYPKESRRMHNRAEILLISRMVDAKNHVREISFWLHRIYLLSVIATAGAVVALGICYAMQGPLLQVGLGASIAIAALWLKYGLWLLSYQFHIRELHRAQHALESLIEHEDDGESIWRKIA